ncbi:NADH-quinone oxidoreductase subunit C [Streptomyces sp. NPDC097107]|uniref:NADH-quinone oxidoreductase subunit C n=1 Tax=Streptomyces sp. NPDC097107 TaxID=3366089 RepID=UPI003809D42B
MTAVGWLPADAEELFGAQATAEESYDVLTVDVPPASWISALETARDRLGCTYFDWLSAVDEPGTGFRVAAHVVALGPVRRLLLRTTVPHETPVLPTAVAVYAGAAWHERETHEMFGVAFEDHPALDHLLLPEGFEGHPLRKDFVLAARVAKAWPGAKEPGESDHGGPRRRQMLPPGVPDPNEWGPLKGQLPPAPARPARGAGRAAGERPARAAGDRPARRSRTAAEGSVGQTAPGTDAPVTSRRSRTAAEGSVGQTAPGTDAPATSRRSRTAAEGSAGQTAPAAEPSTAPPTRRARSASEGSASQRTGATTDAPTAETTAGEGSASQRAGTGGTGGPRRARSASEGSASMRAASDTGTPDETSADPATSVGDDTTTPPRTEEPAPETAPSTPRSPDAPWHHARPAFDEAEPESRDGAEPGASGAPDVTAEEKPVQGQGQGQGQEPETGQAQEPEPGQGAPDDSGNPKKPDRPNPPGGPQ